MYIYTVYTRGAWGSIYDASAWWGTTVECQSATAQHMGYDGMIWEWQANAVYVWHSRHVGCSSAPATSNANEANSGGIGTWGRSAIYPFQGSNIEGSSQKAQRKVTSIRLACDHQDAVLHDAVFPDDGSPAPTTGTHWPPKAACRVTHILTWARNGKQRGVQPPS